MMTHLDPAFLEAAGKRHRAGPVALESLEYVHAGVFASRPFTGNGLPVFLASGFPSPEQMLSITQEFRQFEAVFLAPGDRDGTFRARIFDLFEELPFAGHPLLGAAAVLQDRQGVSGLHCWKFDLMSRTVRVESEGANGNYFAWLDQGQATVLGEFQPACQVASAFGLEPIDLDPSLPMAVITTGLAYLVIPVARDALFRARINQDITQLVRSYGAQFAVLFDEASLEVRHWNNDGVIEDVATGSAAGVIGAYRLRYCGARPGTAFDLHQGRFMGRASVLSVVPDGSKASPSVRVGGQVRIVASGWLNRLPDLPASTAK